MRFRRVRAIGLLMVVGLLGLPLWAQMPDSPRVRAAMAARQFISGAVTTAEFIDQKVASSVRGALGAESTATRLEAIREALSGFEVRGLQPAGPLTAQITMGRGSEIREVLVDYDPEPPHGITNIAIQGGIALADRAEVDAELPPDITWDNLAERLEAEAKHGFAGVVVVIRDGETVVDRAFGMANREAGIPNRKDTIFAVGSTPIDFTHVGILMLAQEDKLSLGDPITRFFEDVPKDKRGITVEHLMTGRSGLQDFHGLPSETNPDHPWIDRDEAMRRIFGQKLLFAPGSGRAHSHSAWGVLAAILEIASGESYERFTRKRIFEPLGMKDTGFYGKRYPKARMAVGYGHLANGKVNAPPFWGRTSWLVMGSGGQVSTAQDMIRFVRGIHEGELLAPEMRARLLRGWRGVLAGGDVFGFEIVYTADPNNMSIMISNYNPPERVDRTVALGEALAQLTLGEVRPGFSLGIAMNFDSDRGLFVGRVVPGSAAERDGLRQGDRLLSANGAQLGDDPMEVLDPLLATGERITFKIERDGEPMTIAVKPNPRG